jgi:hypothetical protein
MGVPDHVGPVLDLSIRQYTATSPHLPPRPFPLPRALRVFLFCLWPPMADYDIFREQLSIKHSSYGHALWEPSPAEPDNPVKVGDVGFIRKGKFHCFFNALLPADGQFVPEPYEKLVPKYPKHISKGTLCSSHYCSHGIGVAIEPEIYATG